MPYQNCTLEKGPRGPHLSSKQWAAWAASSVQGMGVHILSWFAKHSWRKCSPLLIGTTSHAGRLRNFFRARLGRGDRVEKEFPYRWHCDACSRGGWSWKLLWHLLGRTFIPVSGPDILLVGDCSFSWGSVRRNDQDAPRRKACGASGKCHGVEGGLDYQFFD